MCKENECSEVWPPCITIQMGDNTMELEPDPSRDGEFECMGGYHELKSLFRLLITAGMACISAAYAEQLVDSRSRPPM